MRRWVAVLMLSLSLAYLGATSMDSCTEGVRDDCAPVCHIFCIDGCSTAVVPGSPEPPPPDSLPGPVYLVKVNQPILCFDLEPEKEPPRAPSRL